MNSPFSNQPQFTSRPDQGWRPLTLINLFRFIIAGLFITLYITNNLFSPLASHSRELFLYVSILYAVFAVMVSFLNYYRQLSFDKLAYINIFTDIVAVTLLMHASGGVTSGLGTLMVISIGGGSIIMGGRHALLFASLSTIAVLLEELYAQLEGITHPSSYIQAGVLGITFFVTAILTHTFARRIRESEALAQKRGIDLANMAQLTEHIIQRMQTGIIVVDGQDTVRLINESAWYMLGMPNLTDNTHVEQLSPALAQQLCHWRDDNDWQSPSIQPSTEQAEIMPRFARISSNEKKPGCLIYLEDNSDLARQAQQLQLASLGRLTASIAHEIRNPLGAISHAGQLLEESANLDEHDQRLTQIIANHSKRVNTIIENILQLGRRDSSHTEMIELKTFLEKFCQDWQTGKAAKQPLVSIDVEPGDIIVRFDTTHLQQILTNLCENALRYSTNYPDFPKIHMRAGLIADQNRPFLDIIDHGSGISQEDQARIFEPFFTTSTSGTGLGLYLSRELAECNQAHINYMAVASGGSCFRIMFQDPRRRMS